jgi:carbonic anhydrase
MLKLLEGYRRFRTEVYPRQRYLFKTLAQGQNPLALLITCADSRVVPDLITQTEPGDLFICRNVGNLVPPHGNVAGGVSATIEYAVGVLRVGNVIICGHSDCGAMNAVLHPERSEGLANVQAWLRHAEAPKRLVCECGLRPEDRLSALIQENVITQLDHLKTHPSVTARLARGDLDLYGWVYRIETGELSSYDAEHHKFVPVDDSLPSATPRRRALTALW